MGNQNSKVDELREKLESRHKALDEEVRRREDAEKKEEDAEKKMKEQEAQQKKLRQELKMAEEARKRAEEEAREDRNRLTEVQRGLYEARNAQLEAERRLRDGLRPILFPTQAQHAETKRKLHYQFGLFHFAVAGTSGSGKSSLINAFRGVRNRSTRAAPVGVVETTSEVARYPGAPGTPYVWYDVPGAGTLSVPDWQYFTDQGLYIFDCIIIIFDARFTATDIAILRNCVRFQIPSFIVRSKSKQHIANLAKDLPTDKDRDEGYVEDSEDDEDQHMEERMVNARASYIRATRRSVERELEKADLDPQRVYIIDKDDLVKAVKEKPFTDGIDEGALLNDMFALADRYRAGSSEITRAY